MEPVPIQRGAIRPQGRPRRALIPALIRLVAIAGFAFAGWVALSALADSAFAADQPPRHAPRQDAPAQTGSAMLRHFVSRPGPRTENRAASVAGEVHEIGDHPIRYLRSRQDDLLADKDRAVDHVRAFADTAGIPRVGIPDVALGPPVIHDLVHRVTDPHSVLPPAAHERPEAQDETGAPGKTAAKDKDSGDTGSQARHATAAPTTLSGDTAGQKPDDCRRCHGDHRGPVPGPVLPSGQDSPRSGGSSGGHPFPAVADLSARRYPAAQPALDAGTFQRTALTDVSAPGGPSVVPD